jgi:hypothetical protein
MKRSMFLGLFLLLAVFLFAHDHKQSQQSQGAESDLSATTESMSHEHHHEMGPHMHMSALRDLRPGDEEKAQAVVDQARQALEKYRDYNAALADGFKIFLPNVPQKMYHFTNWQYAVGAAFSFDPTKPTSLLYEKNGNSYKLIGAMYTAPYRFSENQLDARIPLSVAQWHLHVNLCKPPQGQAADMLGKNAKFGLAGSISTKEECDAAGGTFMPHVFGWMVHMYPWEKTPDAIWSVERQMKDKPAAAHHHDGMDMSH